MFSAPEISGIVKLGIHCNLWSYYESTEITAAGKPAIPGHVKNCDVSP